MKSGRIGTPGRWSQGLIQANVSSMSTTYGIMVERRVRYVAATLGVPEFVYVPPLVRKSGAVREVGDGILYCGAGGAVLQVKARARREGRRDSSGDAVRWIVKHVERAVRQGRGSKRTIISYQGNGDPLSIVPFRSMVLGDDVRAGFEVVLDSDCSDWPIIVVVDHPKSVGVELPQYEDAFCVTLSDWLELNRRIRSVHGLLRYVNAVLEAGSEAHFPLGHESERFSEVASLELSRTRTYRGSHLAVPVVSSAATSNPRAVANYRQLIDNTWGPNEELPGLPIGDYRAILDFFDDAPASVQEYVGLWLSEQDATLRRVRHRVSGTTLLGYRPLVYMCDFFENQPDRQDWFTQLWGLTAVRAIEWREQMKARHDVVGVGVRYIEESEKEYTYILMRPEIEVPGDVRKMTEWTFGFANFRTFRTDKLKVGRNEQCPCSSGKKFKKCHGLPSVASEES